jgi:GDPmannose 4,6-dehydratase
LINNEKNSRNFVAGHGCLVGRAIVKRAFITGITGQDGSYLAEFLLGLNYEVHGLLRRSSNFNTQRIDHIFDKLHLHHGDLTDITSLMGALRRAKPVEVYNLAAQSQVAVSFQEPLYTAQVTGFGALNLLEAVREVCPDARYYQASSSEQFGSAWSWSTVEFNKRVQDIATPFQPCSPYGVAKVFAHQATINARESYGLHASCGILFNHESPRRGPTFVTRKITMAIPRILAGHQKELRLGNLNAFRDWGYAPEYVEAMWMMLQRDKPGDYIIATGESHSISEFLAKAFSFVNLDYKDYVKFDGQYCRPAEVAFLCGDANRSEVSLGWKPKTSFHELVRIMVDADIQFYASKIER